MKTPKETNDFWYSMKMGKFIVRGADVEYVPASRPNRKGGHTHNHKNNKILRTYLRSKDSRKCFRSPKIFDKILTEVLTREIK